ncbi:MAG TPA: hypothetical protein QF572_01280 [Vicinamibacterales bacterium]|nr:hypothetical protein [Vicinamibacterales bacterium]HJN42793.1 hypothetical protein [Vicinamibacterales bacterium]
MSAPMTLRVNQSFVLSWWLRLPVSVSCLAVMLLGPAASKAGAQPNPATSICDLRAYTGRSGAVARVSGDELVVEWAGAGSERVRLRFAIRQGVPVIDELALRSGSSARWTPVATDLSIDFQIVEGFRRISNQQLAPLRGLDVELTQEVVDRYKWDVFWDAPLDLRAEVGGGNPPPAEGVAGQPGLPRSPDEIRRGAAGYRASACTVRSEGRRLSVSFSGLTLGSFSGALVLSVHEGTNLIRVEAVASTERPSVAYKYDVGLTGLDIGPDSSVYWRDVATQLQSYSLKGPANTDAVTLRAANRLVVAETNGAAIAAFPPPHTFFWAREVEINVGYNWYRKDDDASFSIGVRQGEQEAVERYLANWSLYSAPPGTEQHMAAYFYPTLGDHSGAFEAALAFTNGDVYRPLPGHQVMGSHYHTNLGRSLMATGSIDSRLSDFEVIRAAGINIAGPVDRPRDATQLEEQRWLFEGAERHSDETFMVLPEMENSNLLGGHWDLLFSHPVYYVDARPAGNPLVTEHPEYGRMYNIGSVADMMAMIAAEDMLVYMPHPRTKGSTGYPDAIRETTQFLDDRYRGVGWRWGMGSDLSEIRLSGKRVIPLLDDMNNWVAGTSQRPKYLLAITETYFKAPGDDVYANGPVSYLRLDELPPPGAYAPIIDVLERGDYFVTSGEVLIPSHRYEGSDAGMRVVAEVEWTFPLEFVEVVFGDGERTTTHRLSATDHPAFGHETFTVPFDATGQAWVRFAAWDSAGNGAMTMPVRLGEPR